MTLQKPRAVLFDWDDTIVDNWDTAFQSLNAALVHMGLEAWTEEEARRRATLSARDFFTKMFGDRWEEADKVYYSTFVSLVLNNIHIFADAENLLKKLQGHGIRMAVVSNKRNPLLRQEVEHIGFLPYFDEVIGAGEAEADKPSPAPLLLALNRMGIPPGEDVWYLGDSHTDLMSAIAAGCTPVLFESKLPPADLLAQHPPRGRFDTHAKIMEFLGSYFS